MATEPWLQEIPVTLSVVAAFLAKSSSFYNPIVYVFTVKRFRREMVEVLRCGVSKDANATIATHFALNDVKRPLGGQKESDSLLSDTHRSRSEPSTDIRGNQESNDHNKNELQEQEKGLLVVSQVHGNKNLESTYTLYDMPYMGPDIKGTLSEGTVGGFDNDISKDSLVKKETKVVLIEIKESNLV